MIAADRESQSRAAARIRVGVGHDIARDREVTDVRHRFAVAVFVTVPGEDHVAPHQTGLPLASENVYTWRVPPPVAQSEHGPGPYGPLIVNETSTITGSDAAAGVTSPPTSAVLSAATPATRRNCLSNIVPGHSAPGSHGRPPPFSSTRSIHQRFSRLHRCPLNSFGRMPAACQR